MDVTATSPQLLLLGPPQVASGGQRHAVPDTLQGYLLAWLACHGEWIAREQLAALLWPESGADESLHHLRVNLSRLRPWLQQWGIEPMIAAERRRVRVQLATDVAQFRAAAGAGQWGQASTLPRGRFLQGFTFRAFPSLGEWASNEGAALLAKWRSAILAQRLEPAPALALADAYLLHDTLDEEVTRLRLSALVALGRGHEAQRGYEAHRARLRAEVGVETTSDLDGYLHSALALAPRAGASAADSRATIGREADAAALAGRMQSHRVVTVVGIGGVGKTQLARDTADALARDPTVATVWLDAAGLRGPHLILRRLADALHLAAGGGADPAQAIAAHLGDRACWVVLDGAEALLDEHAAFAADLHTLLDRCPSLRCLATSRAALKLTGEAMLQLGGLALPATQNPAAVADSPAVRLFISQARRALPTFDPRPVWPQLATIAALTGGMPLALRLAAAWLRLMPIGEIVEELTRGLSLLDAGAEGAGVRAGIEGSWQRLGGDAQLALARLAMFESTFSADAAQRVADAAMHTVAELCDASLLTVGSDGARASFELHPLIRLYAMDRLRANAQLLRRAEAAHAGYVARRLSRWGERLRSHRKEALSDIGQCLGDAIAAWHRAVDQGDVDYIVETAAALGVYFEDKGLLHQGIDLFAAAKAAFDGVAQREVAARAAVERARATLLYRAGSIDEAGHVGVQALELARRLGHAAGIIGCANLLGLVRWMQGHLDEAQSMFSEALTQARASGDRYGQVGHQVNLALLDKTRGRDAAAEAGFRAGIALSRELNNWSTAVRGMNSLGDLLRRGGRLDEAQAILEEGLRLADENQLAAERPVLLINLAQVRRDASAPAAALALAQLAKSEARRLADKVAETAIEQILGEMALVRGDLVQAAGSFHNGLLLVRQSGDVANALEGLVLYGRWCAARGRIERAMEVLLAVRWHPQVQSHVRRDADKLLRQWDADPERAPEATSFVEATVLLEQAVVELGAATSDPGSA